MREEGEGETATVEGCDEEEATLVVSPGDVVMMLEEDNREGGATNC